MPIGWQSSPIETLIQAYVYPTLAAGATVVSSTANWTYGAYAEVVPASTITTDFRITGIAVESCNRDAVFELQLYKGATDVIVSSIRFSVNGGFFGNQVYLITSTLIDANARVRARLASSNGAAEQATITASIMYTFR
jgi:hypothetical protein